MGSALGSPATASGARGAPAPTSLTAAVLGGVGNICSILESPPDRTGSSYEVSEERLSLAFRAGPSSWGGSAGPLSPRSLRIASRPNEELTTDEVAG